MATFPAGIPSLTRPTTGEAFDTGPTKSSTIIDALSDEVEAIADNIGITGETSAATIRGKLEDPTNGHTHDGVDSALAVNSDHDHSGDAGDGGVISHTVLDDVGADDHHDENHALAAAVHTGHLDLDQQGEEIGILASDATFTSNTTLANLTDVNFDVEANATYIFTAVIFYEADTGAADAKIDFTGPSSPTRILYSVHAPNISGTGLSTNIQQIAAVASAFSTALQLGGQGAGVVVMAIVRGILVNGANSGVVQLRGAQDTSDSTSAIFKAGTHLLGKRVA